MSIWHGIRAGRPSRSPVAAAVVALALGVAACGSDSGSGENTTTTSLAAAATTTTPTTVPAASATTTAPTTDGTPTTTTAPSSDSCPTFTEKPDLPLKLCDKGDKVKEVQQGLVDAGYEIVVDGFFGTQTRGAVQEFQAAQGIEVDGIVGPITFGKLFPT